MTAKIKLNAASGGGSFSLQAPSSSSNDRVMTLPDTADGTILTTTNPKAGNIIQVVSAIKTDTASTNSTSFVTTGLEKAITITSGNKVLVMIDLYVGVRSGYSVAFQLYNGSSQVTTFQGDDNSGSIRGFAGDFTTPYSYGQVSMSNCFLDSPSGTSQTYKVYFRSGYSDTSEYVYLNRPHTNNTHAQSVAACSTITLMEIAA